ncbi:MAG: hypothetical protein UT54_C0067G0022 [Candidatus Daviesbacteria bacterium GW2011_GWB1_39_5]|uniref:RecF/RecN/SMC N-terminal domain-containing protein n=1 Tax=Candidatus Daviesbacteria bacterium GW2011_GWC2_40_12 TaxID=1618431 RepID=A0A0G0T5A0_9BACT|nr:MAG: hypothetical protein UT54_C0067G0022 [Candidatus Daviesbacteria bacterium GW2011_GWB1_39_5]KKR42305.1 MAG: hypothetical protein UT77_C0003G0100 [Candidatus Daviesbacteria bacterium GW2011_GWC2_40_12]OGE22043.1 MAG: hypothetical protein A2778_01880 [Candidatus Daviesbacteria bacterium RIFCSPHIGHO2_01_FULL_40_24]OGE28708.1 MAG: hypothetical protein A3C29_03975 [Candidatus Daviesbacteria bacterium RIFCSPHIGHO2_02_FULL_40_16]OGE42941.1 MAG: hypothetical protein A3A53_06470 [Candidatus Davie
MRVEEIKITGFRGFENFEVKASELTGFIVLAGQNGTGKSTILEVANFLLNSVDINQIDTTVVSGITGAEAVWRASVSLSDDDLGHLAEILVEKSPNAFTSRETVLQTIQNDLQKKNGRYFFTVELSIPSDFSPQQPSTRKFIGASSQNDIPSWLSELGRHKVLGVFVKPLQDIGEGGTSFLGAAPRDVEMTEVVTGDFDIRQRTTRSNIQLGSLLNRLAMMAVWRVFSQQKVAFPELEDTLSRINEIIYPLELSFDKIQAEKGEMKFRMTNKKINRSYPIQFASSGERQVIGLAAMLIQWERQAFKPIVLIDEPDIHLHPEYVTRLAEFMNGVFLKAKDFSCLVSTHSSDFISANTENVYQITSDSKSIEKVDNLTTRVELLNSLGKRFDLAFLAPKIVYVEGIPNAKDHLEDFKVYQRLIDPLKNCVVFIPAGTDNKPGSGSKPGVIQTSDAFRTFIGTLTQQPSTLNILALIDKDDEGVLGQIGNNVLVTPYKTLENVFLFDIEAIADAASSDERQYKAQDVTNHLEAIEKDSSTKLMEIDGKVMTKKLYDRLSAESSKVKNLTYKGFQFEVIKSIDLSRLPDEVSKFFNSIKGK